MSARKLSDKFVLDLKSGVLSLFVDRVKQDNTLLLCVRNGYINIYYRGGNLLKIEEKTAVDGYSAFFDTDYIKNKERPEIPDSQIVTKADTQSWVDVFKELKEIMDFHLTKKERLEREFQQVVARENNFSRISNSTEYFITDVEFAEKGVGRFDLLAIKWNADSRQSLTACQPVVIEMKYGDDAFGGSASLEKHVEDFTGVARDSQRKAKLIETINYQYNVLFDLGLVRLNKKGHIQLDPNQKLEVVFLLSNTNPRSKILRKDLDENYWQDLDKEVSLKFFVSRFSGYGMHSDCMRTLSEFKDLA